MRKQFKETIIDINDEKIVLILGDVSVYLFDDFKIKNPMIGKSPSSTNSVDEL